MKLAFAFAVVAFLPGWSAAQGPMDLNYLFVFDQRCGTCHGATGAGHAPNRASLGEFPPERILNALTSGPMAVNAKGLSDTEKRGLAEYLSGRALGSASDRSAKVMSNQCSVRSPLGDPTIGPAWNGMSPDPTTSARFQSTAASGLTAEQVPRLQLKWAFGMPDGHTVRGQPTVSSGRVFVGSDSGMVYSVDARTGCVYWSFEASTSVTTAISVAKVPGSVDRYAAYFGDFRGRVYSVDASTGTLLWSVAADTHPQAKINGSPVIDIRNGRLYVPVGSMEEAAVPIASYECCTFQGMVVALDLKTGSQLWKSYTIPERPRPVGKNSSGTQLYGPAGAGVWVAPTLDYRRGVLYVGTSNAYNDVPDAESNDAVIAFDLETGKRRWSMQLLANDANDVAETNPNDDVSGSVVLDTLPDGRQILIAGQEMGRITALDPDREGAILWVAQSAGNKFSPQGGGFGGASDGERYYRPQAVCTYVADSVAPLKWHCQRGFREMGVMVAFRASTGARVWSTEHRPITNCANPDAEACSSGLFGAATVIPGAVFAGSRDGILRAYSTRDGKVLWEYDTKRQFTTINGVCGQGGSIGGHGPAIAGGMVFMGSGYNILTNGHGNVLLAFGID